MKNRANGGTIPAFPNSFPYNELLFRGKLSAKTRTWRWNHTGLTLLYTSTSTARDVAEAHGLDPKSAPRSVLVGIGELVPVRELTSAEADQIEKEFANGRPDIFIGAGQSLRIQKPETFQEARSVQAATGSGEVIQRSGFPCSQSPQGSRRFSLERGLSRTKYGTAVMLSFSFS